MLLMAFIGLACILTGYRLFCNLPAINGEMRNGHPRRARLTTVLLTNVVPGALLALLGAGLLTTEIRGLFSHEPQIQRRQPVQGTSLHRANATRLSQSA